MPVPWPTIVLWLFLIPAGSSGSIAFGADAEPASGGPESADARYRTARNAAAAGDFATALQVYSQLLQDAPNNVDYLFGYAQVLFWSDDAGGSCRALVRARQLAPEYEDVWVLAYRVMLLSPECQSRMPIDEFRRLAAERFPDARWYTVTGSPAPGNDRWVVEASRERLDDESPDWTTISAHFDHRFTSGFGVGLNAGAISRFGTTDTQFAATMAFKTDNLWTVLGGVAMSSSPTFLAEMETEIAVSRELGSGWVGSAGWLRRDYAVTKVNILNLTAERYVGRIRAAYAPRYAHLDGDNAWVHVLSTSFNLHSGGELLLIVAAGEEIEAVSPGQLLRTDVTSAVFGGRHPVNDYLSLGWRIGTHEQGRYYRRTLLAISLSGGF